MIHQYPAVLCFRKSSFNIKGRRAMWFITSKSVFQKGLLRSVCIPQLCLPGVNEMGEVASPLGLATSGQAHEHKRKPLSQTPWVGMQAEKKTQAGPVTELQRISLRPEICTCLCGLHSRMQYFEQRPNQDCWKQVSCSGGRWVHGQ